MKKIVTMGEIMVRLSAPSYQKLEQAQSFDVTYGGGEANVAISLAQFGYASYFVTTLPDQALGRSAAQHLNRYGVRTDDTVFKEGRLGVYYLEKGFSLRASKVIYDRKGSAFAESTRLDYDLHTIFQDADWFHVSGITPALSDELYELTKYALEVAQSLGVRTSCDLNYRQSLWSFDEAREKMTQLLPFVDVCIGIEPLQLLDDYGDDWKDQFQRPLQLNDYKAIMRALHNRYGTKWIVTTMREHVSVNRNRVSALLSDGTQYYESAPIDVEFVDRVGSGDAFAAGLIHGFLADLTPDKTIRFATGCFAWKHTIEGDANLSSLEDIEAFIHGEGTTIQR